VCAPQLASWARGGQLTDHANGLVAYIPKSKTKQQHGAVDEIAVLPARATRGGAW
jgi:hypothetical protein